MKVIVAIGVLISLKFIFVPNSRALAETITNIALQQQQQRQGW